jgi:hypothetical protein
LGAKVNLIQLDEEQPAPIILGAGSLGNNPTQQGMGTPTLVLNIVPVYMEDATVPTDLRYGAPMNVAPVPIPMANIKPACVATTEPVSAENVTHGAQVPTNTIPTPVSVAHMEPTPTTIAAAPTANVVPATAANIPPANAAYTAVPVSVHTPIPAANVSLFPLL